MSKNLIERIKSYPNVELEDLVESSSPKVRFEFHAEHDGHEWAFFSIEGYRVGTLIAVKKSIPNTEEMAQKILDESVKQITDYVDNAGFQRSISVVHGGRVHEHTFN